MSQNIVNFDFQGIVDLFTHEISGDWSQIMSKLDFSSEISTTSADLIENTILVNTELFC